MKLEDIPVNKIIEAPWNSNRMDEKTREKLETSIRHFGLMENLVVRKLPDGSHELLSGSQRFKSLVAMGYTSVPCLVVNLDDAQAKLLSQAMNRIRGQDDLGAQAELINDLLKSIPEAEVLSILPETAGSLKSLAGMNKLNLASFLQNWDQARTTRLKHLQFQLTDSQLKVVEQAIARVIPLARQKQGNSPNTKGTALYLLCQSYLEKEEGYGK